MQSTRFPRSTRAPLRARVVAHIAALGVASVLASGCAESAPTEVPRAPNAIIIIGGQPEVLNYQLRGDAAEWPASTVGNLQLKLYPDGQFELKGMLRDSQCVSLFGGGMYFIQDSEENPNPELRALIDIPLPEEQSCGDVPMQFELSGSISEELAARMIHDPENFVFAFFAEGGGAIVGTFQIGNPNEAPTR